MTNNGSSYQTAPESGKSDFRLPPQLLNKDGEERRVGVEIELSAPDIDIIVDTVRSCFAGTAKKISDVEWEVCDTPFGTFGVEVDFDYLKKTAKESDQSGNLLDEIQTQALGTLSSALVPFEVVTPPIPLSRLSDLNRLTTKLRELGATGTRDALWKAFGLHLNPELPSLDADTCTRYLKAYMSLHDWLAEREKIDLTRRISPYIDYFEDDYIQYILPASYQPDMDTLIDDYLRFNPTRNRSLDMLPLFSFIDDDRVRAAVSDGLIKSRPTFHYRLPNCDIDNPEWFVATAWNHWFVVEKLAANEELLKEVAQDYLDHMATVLPDVINPWLHKIEQWVTKL